MKWSPDGKFLAVEFREAHPDWTKEAEKHRKENDLSTPPWVIDTPFYRLDGDGMFGGQRGAIYIVDVATGKHRKVYSGGPFGFYSYDWAPDSKLLAVAHSTMKNPWKEKPQSAIFLVDLKGKVKKLASGGEGHANLAFSPDGKSLAYTAQTQTEGAWGSYNQRVWVVQLDGSGSKCLTENDDYCFEAATLSDTKEFSSSGLLLWTKDSKKIYTNVGHHGQSQVGVIDPVKGGVKILTEGRHWIAISSLGSDGKTLAVQKGDVTTMNEIGLVDATSPSAMTMLTSENHAFHEEVTTVPVKTEWLESTEGAKVQIWVLEPAKKSRRGAAILQVHGGPHAQYGELFFHEMQFLAAQGYTVVMSNPRGSKGYGEAHCNAISGNWGGRDWEDIQTVLHWMQHQPTIHAGLIGIMGGSYGGYMTNWAIGHTNDFRAAITDRCVSNLLSMGGNSDFVDEKDGYFGKGNWFGPLDEIASRWKQSPIAYFDQVQTPTLIIHSEGDLRCNVEQADQVYSALWQRGIETRYVRYPRSTFHGLSRSGPPDLRLHRLNEIATWWKRQLQDGS